MNWTLLKIIKAKLDNVKGAWPEELPNILWAYRTMARTPTRETPFRLTYGTEAVILVEVGVTASGERHSTKRAMTITCGKTWIF